jgi:hypothetical protein
MTVTQILVELAPHKPMTAKTLYGHINALKIEPIGNVRQCPQQYPDDTPKRVLKRLGITLAPAQRRAVRA